MIYRRESLFFLLCRTSFTLAEAKMCYIYERGDKSNEEKKIVAYIYCDPNIDDCCDTGCCAKIITYKETDSVLVFIYVVLSVSVLLILTRCFTCFCKQQINATSTVDNRYSPHDTEVMISAPPPYIAPPPPYDAAVLAPPLVSNDKVPSYEDVIAGKIT